MQYTNGFICAVDKEKEEVILNFVQRSPEIDELGVAAGNKVETVASLVMGRATAQNIVDYLSKILSE